MTAERRKTEQMRAALGRARTVINGYRRELVAGACLLDKRRRPRRETLDEDIRPHVEKLERLLRSIDRALSA